MPLLVIKAEQAKLVLAFPYGALVNNHQPDKVVELAAIKLALYERTLVLNARGAPQPFLGS